MGGTFYSREHKRARGASIQRYEQENEVLKVGQSVERKARLE